MPIHLPFPIRNLTPAGFDAIDNSVMSCAYAAQNALGRLCDERVYENMVASLLRKTCWDDVQTQMPVRVCHDRFEKVYRFDLLVQHALYELKTVQMFTRQHDAQVLHYAMLANVNHTKLLNFRPAKVRGLLRHNAVLGTERFSPRWHDSAWRSLTPRCQELHQQFADLLADWGTHLDFRLYEEALVFFCGGEATCVKRVPIVHEGFELGTHALNSHADGLAFMVTAFPDPTAQYEQIRLLRALTGRRAIQWMNLNKRDIHLVTVC